MTDHIIHSEDGQTYDLTHNRITFGLLPKDVQEAMKAWPHGWELFYGCGKWEPWEPKWSAADTHRIIILADNHRIIILDDGKGNLTATMEAL